MAESENVRRLLAIREAHERGDFDLVTNSVHPEFELVRIAGGPESTDPLRGREEFRSWMEPDVFESMWFEIVRIHDNGDQVLLEAVAHGVARDSGIEVDQPTFLIWYFRDGLPVRLESYTDRAEAFAAADIGEG